MADQFAAQTSALQNWIEDYLPVSVNAPDQLQLQPLSGDAGFRRYFRVNSVPSLMAVYAPPANEDNPAFVSKALALQAQGVHVPRIFAVDYQHGYMLLEDFGDDLYSEHLAHGNVSQLYDAAEDTLLRIQQMSADSTIFPPYDSALLHREMALLPEWFLGGLLNLELMPEERELLQQTFDRLAQCALSQPQVPVHRDFHCRNLMVLPANDVGVLDFQDGVIGAITYDLVSLLKDCYVRWPREWVVERVNKYAERLRLAGMLSGVDDQQFLYWFDLMGLQRHIKVLGIFSRLWLRDNKARYLQDLPLVIRYTLEVAERYPEFKDFHQWFVRRVLPALPQHDWYSDWQVAGE